MSSPVIRMAQNMWHFKNFKPFHMVARNIYCYSVIESSNVRNGYSSHICKQFFGSSSAHGKSVSGMQSLYCALI